MADAKVRYAVVGLGNIAQVAVLPGFGHASRSQLVALVSSDDTKRTELAWRYGVEHAGHYDQLEEILRASRADAVYVALPNHLHRTITERAARAGVHVLCEKPMADTEEDCHAMLHATRDAGVKLMIAYRLHFEAANLRTVELIEEGRIGAPRFFWGALSHTVRPGNIRTRSDAGGGALLDAGIYPINAARYLFRDEPIETFAHAFAGARTPHVDAEAFATLRFPGDRIAQIAVSQRAANVSAFRIVGTTGDITVEQAFGYATPSRLVLTRGDDVREERFPRRDQFGAEIEQFTRCILDDREPEPSGEEGLADVRICLATLASARAGHPLELIPIPRARRPEPSQRLDKPEVDAIAPIDAPSPEV